MKYLTLITPRKHGQPKRERIPESSAVGRIRQLARRKTEASLEDENGKLVGESYKPTTSATGSWAYWYEKRDHIRFVA